MFNNTYGNYDDLSPKDKLLALKVIVKCNEAKYTLFKDGPSILNVQSLEERLGKIENKVSLHIKYNAAIAAEEAGHA